MIGQNTVFKQDGDDGFSSFSTYDDARIATRTEELLTEKFRDVEQFKDLMAGIDGDDYWPQLHRAMLELDSACNGDAIAATVVLQALGRIQRRIKDEMQDWHEECEAMAERELIGGEL